MPFPVNNIRRACKLAETTIAELERELGIGNGVIAKWEKAKKQPPYDRLSQIASKFGMTVEELSNPDIPEWEIAASVLKAKNKNPAPTNGNGTDDAILRFLHSLPIEKLVGILTLVDAPKELIAALNLEERKE